MRELGWWLFSPGCSVTGEVIVRSRVMGCLEICGARLRLIEARELGSVIKRNGRRLFHEVEIERALRIEERD